MNINLESIDLIFEEMPNPAFFHDDQFRLLKANKAYFDEAGIPPQQAIGKPYYEIFPLLEKPLGLHESSLLDPNLDHFREEFSVGDKTFISFSYVHRDINRNPLYFFHVLNAVTQQKQSEDRFKKIVSQFSTLFSYSPDAIMLLDENVFFECNPATLKLFGCSKPDEFIGKSPSKFSPPFQPDGTSSEILANRRIAETFKNGSNLFEWTHCRLDGTEFPAEVLLVAFTIHGERALQATVRNITDRKKAEMRLANTAEQLNEALAEIISTLSKMMELRDPYTSGHQARVSAIAIAIANKMHLEVEKIKGLEMAALLHDVGKIAIPAEILTKPSQLSEFEIGLIREHPAHGYALLKDINFPWPIAKIVYQHHERLDGSGYPLGLNDDQILVEAKVLGVADTLEAISTNRPYRTARGLNEAIGEIKKGRGVLFDPQVVDAALELFEGKKFIDEAISF